MRIGSLFWILMILWFIFGLWLLWPASGGSAAYGPMGGNLLLFILLGLLGWKSFGAPLKD